MWLASLKDRDILDYNYLGNLQDVENKNIREDRLRAYLRLSGYSQKLIDGAVTELVKAAGDMTHGLYDANRNVYTLFEVWSKSQRDTRRCAKDSLLHGCCYTYK